MMMNTGSSFEGYRILEYCGFISTETVMGVGMFEAFNANNISNVIGAGGEEPSELTVRIGEAKARSLNALQAQAVKNSGNAIIGVKLDFTMFGN